jgi:hypothetical protein
MPKNCEICKKVEATHIITVESIASANANTYASHPDSRCYVCRGCIPKMRMEIKSEPKDR